MSHDASRLRQRLAVLEEKRARQLELALKERGPCIRGAFGARARTCGNPNCRCASGELHVSKCLSASVGGRTRLVHVPSGDELEVAAAVERYRRWRAVRAEVADLSSEQLSLLDKLGATLLQSYPSGNPIPPPGRPGRKPKGGRAPQR